MLYDLLKRVHPLIEVNDKLFLLNAIERIIPTTDGMVLYFLSGGSLPLNKDEIKEFEAELQKAIELIEKHHALVNNPSQIVVPTITGLKGN